jgi:2-iminobutanoate/2-iminopropanoate deaminase
MRAGTARSVVAALEHGVSVEDACRRAVLDLASLPDVGPEDMMMNLIAVDRHGSHCAVSTHVGIRYAVRESGMTAAELRPRLVVDATTTTARSWPEAVSTDAAPGPTNGAPYVQAMRAGDLVFVSGQLPVDVTTGALVEGGIAEQTEQVLRNLRAVLEAAGSSLDRLVRTTVYLRSRDDWPAMYEVYRRVLGGAPPARTALEVGRLGFGSLIELDAVAAV